LGLAPRATRYYLDREQRTEIQNHGIFSAFYGIHNGALQQFLISSSPAFNPYLNLLTPNLPNSEKDFTFAIFAGPSGLQDTAYSRVNFLTSSRNHWEFF